jgi:hypothetical protein
MALTSTGPNEAWQAGFAVRRDWLDRTHEFVRFCLSATEAERFIRSDIAFWRRGPWRPTHAIVVMSRRDFDLHRARRDCRAPDCPTPTAPATRTMAADRSDPA